MLRLGNVPWTDGWKNVFFCKKSKFFHWKISGLWKFWFFSPQEIQTDGCQAGNLLLISFSICRELEKVTRASSWASQDSTWVLLKVFFSGNPFPGDISHFRLFVLIWGRGGGISNKNVSMIGTSISQLALVPSNIS